MTRMRRVLDSRPTVVDLFSGAGLFSLAFAREGFNVVRAVEHDPLAAATYAENFDNQIDIVDIRRAIPKGRCDVIIAGPPCQGFSTLGKRARSDPRNRLSLEVVRWAEVMKPQVIVIENVEAFLRSYAWKLVTNRLEALGYTVTSDVCDATRFGVPQRRIRSATFASRVGQVAPPIGRRDQAVTVREAWAGLKKQPGGDGMNVHLPTSELALARMRVIPPGGDKRDILANAPHLAPQSWFGRRRTDVTDVWGRMLWDQPANTLRTEFVNPSKGRYIHPEQHRSLSLREAARLHSIPDSFKFAQNVPYVVARQIGNSVPPLLGRALARSVLKALR